MITICCFDLHSSLSLVRRVFFGGRGCIIFFSHHQIRMVITCFICFYIWFSWFIFISTPFSHMSLYIVTVSMFLLLFPQFLFPHLMNVSMILLQLFFPGFYTWFLFFFFHLIHLNKQIITKMWHSKVIVGYMLETKYWVCKWI